MLFYFYLVLPAFLEILFLSLSKNTNIIFITDFLIYRSIVIPFTILHGLNSPYEQYFNRLCCPKRHFGVPNIMKAILDQAAEI